MPSIEIDFALTGSTVPRRFTATGTWALDVAGTPSIVCELKDNAGNPVATAMGVTPVPSTGTAGTWSGEFTLYQDHTNLTQVAQITSTSATDDQSEITVADEPAIKMKPVPDPPSPPSPPVGGPAGPAAAVAGAPAVAPAIATPQEWTISGEYSGGVAVLCMAALSRNKNIKKILAVANASLNEDEDTWEAKLSFEPPTGANAKLVFFAALITAKGKVKAKVSRRRRPV